MPQTPIKGAGISAQWLRLALTGIASAGEEPVSVAFEEVTSANWKQQVYEPEIKAKASQLYKKPGYEM